jgi:hypothetical protein
VEQSLGRSPLQPLSWRVKVELRIPKDWMEIMLLVGLQGALTMALRLLLLLVGRTLPLRIIINQLQPLQLSWPENGSMMKAHLCPSLG